MLLTSENIEFYTQRRKQYTQDFLKLTNQFKPKLEQLQRRLIAQKQIVDGPIKILNTTQKGKKFSRVLLSLSKSKEVQNKIDQEMNRCSYQYELDEALNCKFNYSQTCKKIQQSMIPLIENIKLQIKEKNQELSINDQNSNQYMQREELEKIKMKSNRYSKIIEKLQTMETKNQQQDINQKQSFKNLDKFDKIDENEEILGYSEKPITSRRTLCSSVQNDEDKKIQQNQSSSQNRKDSQNNPKFQDLDQIIRKHYKKMGLLNRRQESMMEFKNFITNQRSTTQQDINLQSDLRLQYSQNRFKSNKRFSVTILSTQINSSNITPIFDEQVGIATCNAAKTKTNSSLDPKAFQTFKKSSNKYQDSQERVQKNKIFQNKADA
ncbi:unnamed protein product [Paramecium octaurelia]|uniref:Uncharacterized protein n=1 Tax=Paramecium octaurelia TaxID=43137 RepID=A0A8S1S376_PAROT|nr:unnamed protein product [Paramecium octaurelia]